ncbi:MAG TPA: VWA domain-containing protein [Terriglobales bacterium]|nr:VWA domain-containing protein [Terriglobales bacterium]
MRFWTIGPACLLLAFYLGKAAAQSTVEVTKASASPAETGDNNSGTGPVSTIAVKVKVVNVLATVRDKHGEVIPNLTQSDFTLEEDGKPQTIRYFAHETDLPLTLGLLVDTSLSQRRVLDQERAASRSFVTRMVREDRDKAFVIHFDHEVELLQDLTSSHDKLESALDNLSTPQFSRSNGGTQSDPNDGSGGGHGGYGRRRGQGGQGWGGVGTLLYDSVYLASDEVIKKQEGRKALIILSDGNDRGSKESLDHAIETAQRSDAIVYSILFKDDEAQGGFGRPSFGGGMGRHGGMGGGQRYPQAEHTDGKKILERISKETGGRLFEVTKKQSVEQIYPQIEDELRHQYNLGYTPVHTADSTGYHKIQLLAKKKDLVVQARDGYYGDH